MLVRGARFARHVLQRMSVTHRRICGKQLRLQQEQQQLTTRFSLLRGKSVAVLARDERRELVQLPRRLARIRRALVKIGQRYRTKYCAYKRVLAHESTSLQNMYPLTYKPKTGVVYSNSVPTASETYPYFFVRRGGVYSTVHLATRFYVDVLQARRQASFDTYRARLWDKLTLRRMKKERIVRYWIKGTSR